MDPGTALGVVSLGLSVCQGLLTYYNDWKGYSEDITTIHASAERLSTTLKQVRSLFVDQTIDQEKQVHAKVIVTACNTALEKLDKKLKKLQQHRPTNDTSKVSAVRQFGVEQFQRATYPFKKSTLCKLIEEIAAIQSQLQLSINYLQLDTSLGSKKKLDQIHNRVEGFTDQIDEVAADINDLSLQGQEILDGQTEADLRAALIWLESPDPEVNYDLALSRREPGTGRWILDSPVFAEWKTNPTIQHLWLSGKAGCGKSILSASINEDLRSYCETRPDTLCLMFYFSFTDEDKKSYELCLRSLVAQLSTRKSAAVALIEKHKAFKHTKPSPKLVNEILLTAVRPYRQLFLILDGLDECPDSGSTRETLLRGLLRLSNDLTNLKILATSRDLEDIRDSMTSLGATSMPMDVDNVMIDIKTYVDSQVMTNPKLSRFPETARSKIQRTLIEKANGMFRWVDCQIEALSNLKSTKPKNVDMVLKSLPKDLDATYARMLGEIPEIHHDEALTLLRWLAYARRPLTLQELAETTIIEPYEDIVDFENRGGITDTLSLLGALVTTVNVPYAYRWYNCDICAKLEQPQKEDEIIRYHFSDDEDSGSDSLSEYAVGGNRFQYEKEYLCGKTTVVLAHFSVQEYLESDHISDNLTTNFRLQRVQENNIIIQSCALYFVRYLYNSSSLRSRQDLHAFPLIHYITKYWHEHLAGKPVNSMALSRAFLGSEDSVLAWSSIYDPEYPDKLPFDAKVNTDTIANDCWHEPAPSLYYASYFGLELLASYLIDAGDDVNALGGRSGTALMIACHQGHENVVRLLAASGADLEIVVQEKNIWARSKPSLQCCPLKAAAMDGHLSIVDFLLEKEVDINQETAGETALYAAVTRGHEAIARLLIRAGAEVDKSSVESPLEAAVEHNMTDLVGHLIDHGADPQRTLAAAHKISIAEFLIGKGAKVNLQDTHGRLPLVEAVRRGNTEIMRLLLSNGALVELSDEDGDIALERAAAYEGAELVQILLTGGSEISKAALDAALYTAVSGGHYETAKILLAHGADANAFATLRAAVRRNLALVLLLLDSGANPNGNGSGISPLQVAVSQSRYKAIVGLLLERGADVEQPGGKLGRALHDAARAHNNASVVKLLLDYGADVNAIDATYGTPLHNASGLETSQVLLAHGADISFRNSYNGRNAIEKAIECGYPGEISCLLDHGADREAALLYAELRVSEESDIFKIYDRKAVYRLIAEHKSGTGLTN